MFLSATQFQLVLTAQLASREALTFIDIKDFIMDSDLFVWLCILVEVNRLTAWCSVNNLQLNFLYTDLLYLSLKK